jgi:hypothetical protein
MVIQVSEGLPLLEISPDQKSLVLSARDMEPELVSFYDRFLAEDAEAFAISREFAPGLFEMIRLVQESPERYGPFIKGQTVGPVTFLTGIKDGGGKSLLHHPDLREALVKGLALRALWQAKALAATGKKPILFLDEPCLSGYGSAFTALERHDVISMIGEVISYLKERTEALVGIHCCGNTDWSMILETGPDIISFDAFSYRDHFFLYPGAIRRFLERGGVIAWGIIPTGDLAGTASLDQLVSMLGAALAKLEGLGLDPKDVANRSLLSPSCGMGVTDVRKASEVFDLLPQLSTACAGLA